jgi:putative hydrolase of the HAD superfamily
MNPKKYKHIFFDLDRTLWDFDLNTMDAFADIIEKYELLPFVISLERFAEVYRFHNDILWRDYRDGRIRKQVLRWKRFHLTLEHFGISNLRMSKQIGDDFLMFSQLKNKLLPFTHEILTYLKDRYLLYIITNGFEEVQYSKIDNCNLTQYFKVIITSESAGVHKPDPVIFGYALNAASALAHESLMIGDDLEVDIKGAKRAGIDQVYVNSGRKPHNEEITFEISSLIELKNIL